WGALRNAMEEVQSLLDKYQKADLTASLLRMRGYEKDYLQRSDAKLLELMEKEQQQFLSLVARSDIPPAVKAAVAEKLRIYSGTFLDRRLHGGRNVGAS